MVTASSAMQKSLNIRPKIDDGKSDVIKQPGVILKDGDVDNRKTPIEIVPTEILSDVNSGVRKEPIKQLQIIIYLTVSQSVVGVLLWVGQRDFTST